MRSFSLKNACFTLSFLLLFVFLSCGGSNNNNADDFQGAFASTGGQSGIIKIAIFPISARSSFFSIPEAYAQTAVETVVGTLFVSGDSNLVNLNGTFTTATGALSLSGEGYDFTGTVSNGFASGRFTDGNGNSGMFAAYDSTTNSFTVYCGSSSQGTPFQIVIDNTNATAATVTATEPPMTGTLENNIAIHLSGNGNTATGTIENTVITGSVSNGISFNVDAESCPKTQ